MRNLTLLLCLIVTLGSASDAASEQIISNSNLFVGWQLAPPLSGDDGGITIFRNDGGLKVLRLQPNKTQKNSMETIKGFSVPWISEKGYAKYASVRTNAGIWLIGATIELLRPGKTPQTGALNRPRNSPEAVALPDGSILVMGSDEWRRNIPSTTDLDASDLRTVERVRLNAKGQIISEYVAPVPSCRPVDCRHENLEKFALLYIGNDKVMLAGGYGSRSTYIYDAGAGNWRKSAPMNEVRRNFSLTLLPDGRVLAAGGNKEGGNDLNRGMTTEVWDPRTELWSSGPKLPVPMEEQKSLLVNNKTVILAGGRYAGVLAWDIDKPHWRIAATLARARASAGVSWLGDGKLAIAGGLHATTHDETGRPRTGGQRTEGYSIVNIPSGATRPGKPIKTYKYAKRGTQTLIVGGALISSFDGREEIEPTARVELFDWSNSTIRSMPPLPFGVLGARIFWLDDKRVLILALDHSYGFWSDLFDIESGIHKAIEISGGNQQTLAYDVKIAGINGDKAVVSFGSYDVGTYYVLLDFASLKSFSGYKSQRADPVVHVLNNGKIILAGGEAGGSQKAFSRVADCEDCPEVYIEYGEKLPATTYEIFDPAEKKATTSAQSVALGGPLTIFNDGRVAKLGMMVELTKYTGIMAGDLNKSLRLELSNASGTNWQNLILPPHLRAKQDADGLQIKSIKNPDGLLNSILLIGIPNWNNGVNWWWLDVDRSKSNWQMLAYPRINSGASTHGVNLGRLSVGRHTYMLLEDDNGVLAIAE